jgi:hypothetical protein
MDDTAHRFTSGRVKRRLSRAALFATASVTLLSCMTPFLGPDAQRSGLTLVQADTLSLPWFRTGEAFTIYYPVPYVATPHLKLEEPGEVELVEQSPDHFTVKKLGVFAQELKWRAEGVPAFSKPPDPNSFEVWLRNQPQNSPSAHPQTPPAAVILSGTHLFP